MTVNNNRRHYSDKKSNSAKSVITKVPLVLLSMILSGLLLLSASGYFLLKTDSPLSLSRLTAFICLYVCALICGIISSRLFEGAQAYVCAIIASSAFTILLLIMKTVVPRADSPLALSASVLMHSAIIAVAASGVLISQKAAKQNNRRHRKRR